MRSDNDYLFCLGAEMRNDIPVGLAIYGKRLFRDSSIGALKLPANVGGAAVKVLRVRLIAGKERLRQSADMSFQLRRIDRDRGGDIRAPDQWLRHVQTKNGDQ